MGNSNSAQTLELERRTYGPWAITAPDFESRYSIVLSVHDRRWHVDYRSTIPGENVTQRGAIDKERGKESTSGSSTALLKVGRSHEGDVESARGVYAKFNTG